MAGREAGLAALQLLAVLVGGVAGFLLLYRLLTLRRPRRAGGAAAAASPPAAAPEPEMSTRPAVGARDAVVQRVQLEADGVISLYLVDSAGGELPDWEPGAHIDLVLPSGQIRQYSLCGDPADRRHYRIAVLLVPDGRGGAAEAHRLHPGDTVGIAGPRNNFPLVDAPHYLFLAGGIGITPFLPMVTSVAAQDKPWRLVYGGRSLPTMAFVEDVKAVDGACVQLVPQDTDGLPDLATAMRELPDGAAVYCCGPPGLITAVQSLMPTACPGGQLYIERFAPPARPVAVDGDTAFEIELRRSGRVLTVPADRSALAVIREVIPGITASCEEGICGSCAVRVLAGVPDHRDHVLTAAQRERGDVMHPCVSRGRGERLVLDL